jgi:tetratricopeptide (TPR) repeat protein
MEKIKSIILAALVLVSASAFAEPDQQEVATAQNVATTATAKSVPDKCKTTEAETQKCRDNTKSPEEEMACNAFLRGSESYCRGKYDQALAEFKVAYDTKKIPAMLFNIAKCYDRLGEWGNALEKYRAYLKSDDNDPKSKGEAVIRVQELELKLEEESKKPPPESPKPPPSVVAPPSTSPPQQPLYKKWWLWTAVGVGVLAIGGIGIGVAFSVPRDPGDPTIGTVNFNLGRSP